MSIDDNLVRTCSNKARRSGVSDSVDVVAVALQGRGDTSAMGAVSFQASCDFSAIASQKNVFRYESQISTVSTDRCTSCSLVAKDYWKQTEATTMYSGNSSYDSVTHCDYYGQHRVSVP